MWEESKITGVSPSRVQPSIQLLISLFVHLSWLLGDFSRNGLLFDKDDVSLLCRIFEEFYLFTSNFPHSPAKKQRAGEKEKRKEKRKAPNSIVWCKRCI